MQIRDLLDLEKIIYYTYSILYVLTLNYCTFSIPSVYIKCQEKGMKNLENNISRREREKQARKIEIINAAEDLFFADGFENTSMDVIAKKAQFTKRTLYQYFINKEDLFYAVVLRGVEQLDQYFRKALDNGKTALEKIRLSNRAFYQFYKDHPITFRMIYYKPSNNSNRDASPHYQEIMRMQDLTFQNYAAVIEGGKKDGSIRNDLDAKKAAHFAIFSTIGFLIDMSDINDAYWKKYNLEKEDFILFSCDLLADSVSSKLKP